MRGENAASCELWGLLKRADDENLKLVTDATTDAFTAITELTVFAVNHPRLLALLETVA